MLYNISNIMQYMYIYDFHGTLQNSVGHWSRHLHHESFGLGVFRRVAPSVRRRLISARCLALAAQYLALPSRPRCGPSLPPPLAWPLPDCELAARVFGDPLGHLRPPRSARAPCLPSRTQPRGPPWRAPTAIAPVWAHQRPFRLLRPLKHVRHGGRAACKPLRRG